MKSICPPETFLRSAPHFYHKLQKTIICCIPIIHSTDHLPMPRRERKQGWAGVSKLTPTPVRGRLNSAEWPVHVIGNVTFHWNHKPRSRTDEERTAASLAAYIANPNDRPGIPANFKNYQPVWGIVK